MSTLILSRRMTNSRYPNMRPNGPESSHGSMMVTKGISGMNLSNVEKIVPTAYKGMLKSGNWKNRDIIKRNTDTL